MALTQSIPDLSQPTIEFNWSNKKLLKKYLQSEETQEQIGEYQENYEKYKKIDTFIAMERRLKSGQKLTQMIDLIKQPPIIEAGKILSTLSDFFKENSLALLEIGFLCPRTIDEARQLKLF